MARVFISSTSEDLKDHREAVYLAVRHLGHQSAAFEYHTPTDQQEQPLELSLPEIRASDVAIFLVAWRYGWVPPGRQHSVTELEYRMVREAGIPCLVFLMADDARTSSKYFDQDLASILRFRSELQLERSVALFTTPDQLALQVATSLHSWVATGAREPSATPPEAASPKSGPEVFLSYAHEDVAVAQAISQRIAHERWSVFWDRTIPVGFTWDDIVEEALDEAKCIVVLWSPAAQKSEWVRIEATEGAERRILAPALIEQTKIPLRFRQIQAANLVGWSPGVPDTQGMQALLSAIRRCVSGRDRGAA